MATDLTNRLRQANTATTLQTLKKRPQTTGRHYGKPKPSSSWSKKEKRHHEQDQNQLPKEPPDQTKEHHTTNLQKVNADDSIPPPHTVMKDPETGIPTRNPKGILKIFETFTAK